MSKEKSPAFQFYAAEYLADENVQIMTMEEEGCYCRLMAYCWREGSIPADLELLTRLCKGVTPSEQVLICFKQGVESARLIHARLEIERVKQAEWKEKSALGGKRSAHKRKHPRKIGAEQGGSTTVPRVVQPNGNSSSSFSSSFASSEKTNTPPNPQGGTRGIPAATEVFEFWNSQPGLTHHTKLNGQLKAITATLKHYSLQEIKTAIGRYSAVRCNAEGKYRDLYAWTLGEFLTRHSAYNLERLTAENWEAPFLVHAGNGHKPSQQNTFDRLMAQAEEEEKCQTGKRSVSSPTLSPRSPVGK